MIGVDGGIDQVAAQPPLPRQRGILSCSSQPNAATTTSASRNCRDFRAFPPMVHPLGVTQNSMKASP